MGAVGTKQLELQEQATEADRELPVWSGREPVWLKVVAPLLIVCLTLLIYSGNDRAGFQFDDLGTLRDNPSLPRLRIEYQRNTREGDSILRRVRQFGKALGPTLEAIIDYNPYRVVAYGTFTLNDFFAGGTRGKKLPDDPYTNRPVASLHWTNNAIHALNGALVFWLIYLTLTAPVFRSSRSAVHYPLLVALLGGLIFALHPMQTQAVTYLSQRAESLCATFYLLTLCFTISARLRSFDGPRGTTPWLTPCLLGGLAALFLVAVVAAKLAGSLSVGLVKWLVFLVGLGGVGGVVALVKTGRDEVVHAAYVVGAFLCFGLALFTKEIAVSIPPALILWDLVFMPGGKAGASAPAPARFWPLAALRTRGLLRPQILIPVAVVVIGVPVALLFWGGQRVTDQLFAGRTIWLGGWQSRSIGLRDYLLSQANVLHTYARTFVLPTGLRLDYDYPYPLDGFGHAATTVISILGLLAAVIGALVWGARARVATFALLFGLLVLLPSSSFVVLPDVVYEHRFYLPLAGAALVAAVVLERLLRRFAPPQAVQPALIGACFVACLGLGLATVARNRVWDSDLSLWTDNAKKSPHKPRPWTNLGLAYQNREESRVILKSGQVLLGQLAELPGGQYLFRQTARLSNPPVPLTKAGIEEVVPEPGGLDKARDCYNTALELDPDYSKAQNNLALISVYERHNLVLENQFIAFEYAPRLAKHHVTALRDPLRRRTRNNRARIQKLFDVAIGIFRDQYYRQKVSNTFLYNNAANLYFQQAMYTENQEGDVLKARALASSACEWMARGRRVDPPPDLWALNGEMLKFRADVTARAIAAGKLTSDLPQADRPETLWREAINMYGEYMRRSPNRRMEKRIRDAVTEIRGYLSGQKSPVQMSPQERMRKRIREARQGPGPRRGPQQGPAPRRGPGPRQHP